MHRLNQHSSVSSLRCPIIYCTFIAKSKTNRITTLLLADRWLLLFAPQPQNVKRSWQRMNGWFPKNAFEFKQNMQRSLSAESVNLFHTIGKKCKCKIINLKTLEKTFSAFRRCNIYTLTHYRLMGKVFWILLSKKYNNLLWIYLRTFRLWHYLTTKTLIIAT